MKVNAKMKMIVAAVALAATGVVQAEMFVPATQNGSMMLTIWDDTPGKEASFNLNVQKRFNDFSAPGSNFSITNIFSDPVYKQYLGGHDLTALKWNVAAADTSGDFERVMTTEQVGGTPQGTSGAVANFEAAGMATQLQSYMDPLDDMPSDNKVACDSCGTNLKASPKYAGDNWGSSFNSFMPAFNTSTNIGGELGFYSFASEIGNGAEVGTPATYARYEQGSNLGKFTLSNTGDLSYSIAAVPVPAAVWLLGSALVGLVGVARRRNNAAA